jgi:hypothetical protein
MSGSTLFNDAYRPTATDRVRLTVGDHQNLATVLEIEDTLIRLDAGKQLFGPATILFSHPRGVIELTGTLSTEGQHVVFTVTAQRRLEQRRGAFRLAVSCTVHVIRNAGERLEYRTGDLSVTGMRVMNASELRDDEMVELEIVLENGDKVPLTGQVVRRDHNSVGVTFRNVTNAVELQLSRFITSAQRRRLRP